MAEGLMSFEVSALALAAFTQVLVGRRLRKMCPPTVVLPAATPLFVVWQSGKAYASLRAGFSQAGGADPLGRCIDCASALCEATSYCVDCLSFSRGQAVQQTLV